MHWFLVNIGVPLGIAACIFVFTGLMSIAFVWLTTTRFDKEDLP